MGLVGNRRKAGLDRLAGLLGALQEVMADSQIIHFRVNKAAVGIIGSADHRLTSDVEGGVHQNRASSTRLKPLKQSIKFWILVDRDRLHPGGVVNMGDGGKLGADLLDSVQSLHLSIHLYPEVGAKGSAIPAGFGADGEGSKEFIDILAELAGTGARTRWREVLF